MKYKIADPGSKPFVIEANNDAEFIREVFNRTKYGWFADSYKEMYDRLILFQDMPTDCVDDYAKFKKWILTKTKEDEMGVKKEHLKKGSGFFQQQHEKNAEEMKKKRKKATKNQRATYAKRRKG
jgi:hypothetical protein|tara:strand:+ start:739 stop:1110 length:372 start_codon:yes stop_codon:yes gene_type:complete